MDKSLRRTAMVNSGILAFIFTMSTVQAFAAGNTLMGIIGAVASLLTVNDAVKFYNVKPTETNEIKEN